MGLLLEWGQPAAWCSPQSRSAPSSLVLTPIQQCSRVSAPHALPGWRRSERGSDKSWGRGEMGGGELQLRWHHAPGLDA